MSQNVFDNDEFFEGYKKLRERPNNYNVLVEQPAIQALLPDLKGKTVLDLGCGYGKNCIDFINRGAEKVVGTDISEKMLDIATKENSHPAITYAPLDMNDLGAFDNTFDLVYSSMAFHYIKDFNKLISNIYRLLNKNGVLLFSQEHPFVTAPKAGASWNKDDNGMKTSYKLSDYMISGERNTKWFIEGVIKYHRPVSEIINTMIQNGFMINSIIEPIPSKHAQTVWPSLYDEFHKPNALIVKAVKK